MAVGSVADLLGVHREIERAVVAARLCGVAGDVALEARWVRWLDRVLRMHLGHEETWLLPVWAAVPDAPANATAAVLCDEHRRIVGLLDVLAAAPQVEPAAAGPPARSGADALARAEGLATLAAVLEHHDAREAGSFKVRLDDLMDADDRDRVLRQVEADLATLPPAPPLPDRRVPRALTDDGTLDPLASTRLAVVTDRPDAADRLAALRSALLAEAGAVDHGARLKTGAVRKLARALDRAAALLEEEASTAREGAAETGDALRARWLGRLEAFDRLRLVQPLVVALGLRLGPG